MQTIKLTYPHTLNKEDLPEAVAAIGFFDGLHKGHREVIGRAVENAGLEGKKSAVISFYPHPKVVLNNPKQPVKYITTPDEKEALLQAMGVDLFYLITFNQQLSHLSPETFLDHYITGLNVTELVAGFDFSFGHRGAGNMDNIDMFNKDNFAVTTIPLIKWTSKKISSTRIRQLLSAGKVEEVRPLLGRFYELTGIVRGGDQRGRQLGYPTANVTTDEKKLLPKQGVYAVRVILHNKSYNGMANLGSKPTVQSGQSDPSVEVHIFDFNETIYGEKLTIEWCQFIREEKKFTSLDELVNQLQQDERKIRAIFS